MGIGEYLKKKYSAATIRTFCPNCKQWVDVCQNVYGYKFVPLSLTNRSEATVDAFIDAVEFEREDSDDEYRCGNCANTILQSVHDLAAELYDSEAHVVVDDCRTGTWKKACVPAVFLEDGRCVGLNEIEQKCPNGVPGMPNFCYFVSDAWPKDYMTGGE